MLKTRENLPVKIGVISDTHLACASRRLRGIVDRYFHDVDRIIHVGDLVDLSVLDVFGTREVLAVCGNSDPLSVRQQLPERLLLEIGRFRLGVMHGWGYPEHLAERIYALLAPVDCVIYGHTHHPVNRRKEGVLFFNPGSALDNRYSPENTVGILEIADRIKGNIIKIAIEKEF